MSWGIVFRLRQQLKGVVSNNLAFALCTGSSTVMPLVPWAKVTMALQSFISMGILALVVARAVNIFT